MTTRTAMVQYAALMELHLPTSCALIATGKDITHLSVQLPDRVRVILVSFNSIILVSAKNTTLGVFHPPPSSWTQAQLLTHSLTGNS